MKKNKQVFKVSTITYLMMVAGLAQAAPASNTLPTYSTTGTNVTSIVTSGNTMTVTTGAAKAIQSWNTFSLGSASTLNVVQPTSSSILLNNVASGAPLSQIYGTITSNGGVWIVNPQGIYFGAGSSVSTASSVFSTLGITDSNFNSGNYTFTNSGAGGSISLNGAVTATSGSVTVMSPNVTQSAAGSINAAKEVHLLATDNAQLAIDSSGLITTTLGKSATQAILDTEGAITTTNGHIELTSMGYGLASLALVTAGGNINSGGSGNVYINAPYGAYKLAGDITPGGGNIIITAKYVEEDNSSTEARQAAQAAGSQGANPQGNSSGSGLIEDNSSNQKKVGDSKTVKVKKVEAGKAILKPGRGRRPRHLANTVAE